MKSFVNPSELSDFLRAGQPRAGYLGFVPTMGALHDGHFTMIEKARNECEQLVVSIFVNPKQFGPDEDFSRYPRQLDADARELEARGVDVLFFPNAADVYPDHFQTYVTNDTLSEILCGAHRPGHFTGVLTVVLKLLVMVSPNKLYMGKKDFQQLRLVEAMVRDLGLPHEVVACATHRETDGLAMSSRNRYLSEDQRMVAPRLFESLCQLAESATDYPDLAQLEAAGRELLNSHGFQTEYVELRRSRDLARFPTGTPDEVAVLLAAVRLGNTRLIDNVEFEVEA